MVKQGVLFGADKKILLKQRFEYFYLCFAAFDAPLDVIG